MTCTILIAASASDRTVELAPAFAKKFREKNGVYVLHLWGNDVGKQRKEALGLRFIPVGSIYLSGKKEIRWLRLKGGRISIAEVKAKNGNP